MWMNGEELTRFVLDGRKITATLMLRPGINRLELRWLEGAQQGKPRLVLRDVGLITVRKQGPRRLNSLNVVPIRLIYEELVTDYQDLWARRLTGLKHELESRTPHTKKNKSQ